MPDTPNTSDAAAIKAETDAVLAALGPVAGPVLNVLAGIEHALVRIANNTTRVAHHVPEEQAVAAWPLRMYEDQAVPFLEALGIVVDK